MTSQRAVLLSRKVSVTSRLELALNYVYQHACWEYIYIPWVYAGKSPTLRIEYGSLRKCMCKFSRGSLIDFTVISQNVCAIWQQKLLFRTVWFLFLGITRSVTGAAAGVLKFAVGWLLPGRMTGGCYYYSAIRDSVVTAFPSILIISS